MSLTHHPLGLTARHISNIEKEYWDGVSQDRFLRFPTNAPPRVRPISSLRSLILHYGTWYESRGLGFDINMSLAKWFELPSLEGVGVTIGAFAFENLCKPLVINSSAYPTNWVEEDYGRDISFSALIRAARLEETVAPRLWSETLTRHGQRTLASFLVRTPNNTGFMAWEPGIFSGAEDAGRYSFRSSETKRKSIEVTHGTLTLSTCPCPRDSENALTANEWEIRLHSPSGELLAVAVGTIFIKKKSRRRYAVPGYEWLLHADDVSEKDMLLIDAFLEESPDALYDDVFGQGDWCLVLNWERNVHAPKGMGLHCLVEGLRELRKMYSCLKFVLLDRRPTQFTDWASDTDLKAVANLKQSAMMKVVHHTEALFATHIPKLSLYHAAPMLDEDDDPQNMLLGKYLQIQLECDGFANE